MSLTAGFNRKGCAQQGTSLADVIDCPLANRVTSWPWATNSSVR